MATFGADTVTRLAERASRKRGWNVDAAYVDLVLVPAGSEDAVAAGDEGSEALVLATTRPLPSIRALSAVGVRDGSCLLAVLPTTSALATEPGELVARDGGDLAAALAGIQVTSAALVGAVERSTSLARRAELERLLIPPRYSIASSPSSTSSRGTRSPLPDERFQLKLDVISYYGLWDPATMSGDLVQRRVFTVLSPTAEPVALKDAILAHIWPSAFAGMSAHLRRELGLPAAFHVQPRNFLLLDKAVERAFDSDALLLLPARGVPPAPPTVRARVFHAGATATAGAILPLAGRNLHLPLAAEGRVPFMRLLAWKAFSALRADAEACDGDDELPSEVDIEATLSRSREETVAGVGGFHALLSAGLIFGLGRGSRA